MLPGLGGKQLGLKSPQPYLEHSPAGELKAEGDLSLLERTKSFQVVSGVPISWQTLVMLMKDPSSLLLRVHLQKTL